MLALLIFKDNQNIAKVESNILLIRSVQQRKWMVFSRSSHHPNVFRKKGVLKYWANSLENISCGAFFLCCKPATLVKKILMNKRFSVDGWKHLWTTASDLHNYVTTLTIIFDSVENIWNLIYEAIWWPWLEDDVAWKSYFSKIFQLI